MTRLLLTKIPFFREVILSSFYCEHCHFRNNEVQFAGTIQEQGAKYTFKIDDLDELERQVVKSDTASLRIEELDIEVPPGRGRLTNVEGILVEVLKDLEEGQKQRKKQDPELYEKLDAIVQSLIKMLNGGKFPITISIDDPSGNSWIEPFTGDASTKGKYLEKKYARDHAQNAALGLATEMAATDGETTAETERLAQDASGEGGAMEDVDIIEGQTYDLPVECPGCTKPAHLLLQMVNIPYFKQVIISTTQCDLCGYHTNDVKTGGEVPEKGKRIWLDVKRSEDLSRDILKSETCLLKVPECRLDVQPGTMGGRFTTVEGLLTQMRDDLRGKIFGTDEDAQPSDSLPEHEVKAWTEFFSQLDKAIKAEIEYTIIMEDPLGNSYCQLFDEPGKDPQVRTEDYERTAEEDEDLGLADMKTHLNEDGEYVKELPKAADGK